MSGFLEDVKRKYKKFDEMSAEEKAANIKVLLSSPGNYKVVTESADLAMAWSRELATAASGPPDAADFKDKVKASLRGGPADAARHCFWSARLSSKLGYNDAALLVATHEITGIKTSTATKPGDRLREVLETAMDLHNNSCGLKIGVQKANASDDDLKKACLEALMAGQLLQVDNRRMTLVPTKSLVQ